jgi:hypothetical protein
MSNTTRDHENGHIKKDKAHIGHKIGRLPILLKSKDVKNKKTN